MITRSDLAVVPGFQSMSDRVADRVAALAVERRYAKDSLLYRAGDSANGLYIVLSGRVRVSRETRSHASFLHTEGEGGVLGEIPMFGGGAFPATATAADRTRCAHLPADAVERLLREEPEFSRFALRRLAVRARSLLHRIDELTAGTVGSRVAAHVLARAQAARGDSFTLGMSQEELARELGTAREVVVRALSALVDAGAVARAGRSRFTVARLATLRAMASN